MLYEKRSKGNQSECFRTIRTNIKYASVDKDKKVLLFTSAEQGDGKSTTAANLAVSFKEDNKSVIIVDCDLRRPTVHKVFNVSNISGITSYLIGEKDLDEVIVNYEGSLDILPCGDIPPNPAEILATEKLENMIKILREKYDYVIIDTTPLGIVADSQILATKVDGIIVVARYEKTKKDSLVECKKTIEKVGGKLIGVIINRTPINKDQYYYYY